MISHISAIKSMFVNTLIYIFIHHMSFLCIWTLMIGICHCAVYISGI